MTSLFKSTAAISPFGRPYDPAALVRGAIEDAGMHMHVGASPPTIPLAALTEHLAAIAAAAKVGKKPATIPKIRLNILICGDTGDATAESIRCLLRDTGPHCGVSFNPTFAGLTDRVTRDTLPGWIGGVDGTADPTPANLRSWKNRLKPAQIIIGSTTHYPLADILTAPADRSSICVFEIKCAKSLAECAARYERYHIDRAGGRLFITCVGRVTPDAATSGSTVYDDLACI
jgi:hypothetical protein